MFSTDYVSGSAADSFCANVRPTVARRLSHAQKAMKTLGGVGVALSGSQLAQLPASQILLITTPDDVINSVAERLASLQKVMTAERTVLHTSGALSSQELRSLVALGFHTGSLHPLVSVSDPTSGSRNFHGAFFCLEGDPVAVRIARRLVRELGGHGVGHAVHEEPYIPNYGRHGQGSKLFAGMVIAIEPIFTLGSEKIRLMPDGYTIISEDGSLSAHAEHTLVITEHGAEILTELL